MKNRSTWLVNLYLQNTETWYRYYRSYSLVLDREELPEIIREDMFEIVSSFNISSLFYDLLTDSLDDVDWEEVANQFYDS